MSPANLVAKSFLRSIAGWFLSISRGTWLAMAVLSMMLITLAVWAMISLVGWAFGLARDGVNAAPEVIRSASEQITKSFPGVDQALEKLPSVLQAAPPLRDVSGEDFAEVARYPGLTRVYWQRDGQQATVRYEGIADYSAVLDHYVKGFTDRGFTQHLILAKPGEEHHEYRQTENHYSFFIVREGNKVTVSVSGKAPVQ